MIEIVPYQREWPEEFARLGRALRAALGELAVRVDHIGSTSVPGLAAKDIIDIQITASDLKTELDAALTEAGNDTTFGDGQEDGADDHIYERGYPL